jgi:hypothetical protein
VRICRIIILFWIGTIVGCATTSQSQSPGWSWGAREKYDDLVYAQPDLDHAFPVATQIRTSECLQQFRQEQYCHCLAQNLGINVSILDYVMVTTRSKTENGYKKLPRWQRKNYDAAVGVRKVCGEAPKS